MECRKPSNVILSLAGSALFSLCLIAQPISPAAQTGDVSHWKTFANRAGWAIKHPGNWQVDSCRQCSDPTDPNVFVTLFDPATKELIIVEHLIDKPSDQTVEQWLNDVKVTTVLNPIVSEEWISLNGTPALKVINRNADSSESENIYIRTGLQDVYYSK
jgi:hypothetical protein